MVWTVVTLSIAKDGNWFVFNFPFASNEAIPFVLPISSFIKFIPYVKVDKAVVRFVILLCGISGIFNIGIKLLLSSVAIPADCPIALFIVDIPDVKVDKDVERFVILLCGISGIFAIEIWELLSNPA